MIKRNTIIKSLLRYMLLVSVGFLIGVFINIEYTTTVKWTDILTSISTSLGVVLAYVTFIRWVENKKKDDSYLASKEYLKSLDEIRELIREIVFQYFSLCPAPGVLVEDIEVSNDRIKYLNQLRHQLYLLRVNLSNKKNELSFWDVHLNDTFKEKHESFVKALSNLNSVMTGLNSQLYHFYNGNDNEKMQNVRRLSFFNNIFLGREN